MGFFPEAIKNDAPATGWSADRLGREAEGAVGFRLSSPGTGRVMDCYGEKLESIRHLLPKEGCHGVNLEQNPQAAEAASAQRKRSVEDPGNENRGDRCSVVTHGCQRKCVEWW